MEIISRRCILFNTSTWQAIRELISECSLIDAEEIREILCGICGKIMIDACQIICGCRFCRVCIERHLLKNGRCPVNDSRDCRSVILKSMEDVHSEKETNLQILRLRVKCPRKMCDVEEDLLEMMVHVKKCKENVESTDEQLKNRDIEEIQDMTLRKKVDLLKEKMEENIKEVNGLIRDFSTRINSLEKKKLKNSGMLKSLITRANEIEIRINEERNEDMIWKIENFSKKKELCTNISSECFYTRKHGYKLRLVVYPKGCKGQGTYMSLYYYLVKGEYDDILSWPFKYDISVTVLDQERLSRDITEVVPYTTLENCRKYFERPSTRSQGGFGCPKFLNLSTLEASSYLLKNDTLYLRCSFIKA